MRTPFENQIAPDWQELVDTITRQGKPAPVHHIELFLDKEVTDAIFRRYQLLDGVSPAGR